MPNVVGEYVDRICSIELRLGVGGNIARGVTHQLYSAARAKVDGPLTSRMANAIRERVKAGDSVLIVTGAGGAPFLPCAEIDGLLGATALARALDLGLGAEVHILVEPHVVGSISQVIMAGELIAIEAGRQRLPHSVIVHKAPIDAAACDEYSGGLLDGLRPAAVIAIEKLGESSDGVIRGSTGIGMDEVHFKPSYLFNRARAAGILTCGIGDAGNEVGFGSIPEVKTIMPAGAIMATTVATDHLVVAGVSNWGGYGVAALLAFLLRRPDIMTGPDLVERMLRTAVQAGSWDGFYNRPVLCDDGVPLAAHRAIATLVETAVNQALLENMKSPVH